MRSLKLDEYVVRLHMFHLFLIWPLIAGLCPFLMIHLFFDDSFIFSKCNFQFYEIVRSFLP